MHVPPCLALLLLWWTSTLAQAPDWVQSADLRDSLRSPIGVVRRMYDSPVDPDTFPAYFPLRPAGQEAAFHAQALDSFRNAWYSKILSHMHAPVLVGDRSNREIYRFTWLRSFDDPIAVSIEKTGNYIIIHSSTLQYSPCDDDTCDVDYLLIPHDKALLLPSQRWDEVQAQLRHIDFWALPAAEDPMLAGLDGADWVLEGLLNGQYHFTTRWSPEPGNAYRDCCLLLLRLSGIGVWGRVY